MSVHTPYCLGFCFSPNEYGELYVALIRKKKPAWQAGKLNGIGGKIETGESALEGMVREFREETGWDIYASEWRLFARYRVPGAMLFCFTTQIPLCDFKQLRTTTEEEIIRIDVGALHQFERMNNLDWLVPMARVFTRTGAALNIDE